MPLAKRTALNKIIHLTKSQTVLGGSLLAE